MNGLTGDEARVLGVLVEKAQTTPGQYPLTSNGLLVGCNQKSNRHPIVAFDENRVLAALDGLRAKGLSREVMMSGSRVAKYRHTTRETLEVSTAELVILAELLLRGPQTLGEIRGRASRMHPLESLEVVQNVLEHLGQRETPLAKAIGPAPGSRAGRFAQLLAPDLHPFDEVSASASATPSAAAPPAVAAVPSSDVLDRVNTLETEVAQIRAELERLRASLGE